MVDSIKNNILPNLIVPLVVGAMGAVFGSQISVTRLDAQMTNLSSAMVEMRQDVRDLSKEIGDLKTKSEVNKKLIESIQSPPTWFKAQVDDIDVRVRLLERRRNGLD